MTKEEKAIFVWEHGYPINMDEEDIDTILTPLEKQTPVKPKYDHRYAEMGCPVCGNMIGEESPNYCPQCGQAIDWSEE